MGLVVKAAPVTVVPGGDVVLTQADQAIGAAVNITAKEAQNPALLSSGPTLSGSVFIVFGSFDFDVGATSTNGLFTGSLKVDGVAQTLKAVMNDTAIGVRSVTDQQWIISGLSPGAHTLQLFANKANATGTGTVRAANSALVVIELAATYLD